MSVERPRYDFHTHSFFSDGILLPIELIRRAYVIGHKAVAVTDHVSYSNVEQVIPAVVRDCESVEGWDIAAIPGAEITHVPPRKMDGVIKMVRKAGAVVILVHGETSVEPVTPGTNRKAVENPEVDILAHPGFIAEEEAEIARENGVYLEISCRVGHSLTNGHVYRVGSAVGAKFLINSDAHEPEDLSTHLSARRIAIGSGMNEEEADCALLETPIELMKKRGI